MPSAILAIDLNFSTLNSRIEVDMIIPAWLTPMRTSARTPSAYGSLMPRATTRQFGFYMGQFLAKWDNFGGVDGMVRMFEEVAEDFDPAKYYDREMIDAFVDELRGERRAHFAKYADLHPDIATALKL